MAEDKFYLIFNKDYGLYLEKGSVASYISDISKAIHTEIPDKFFKSSNHEIIPSDNPKFKEILEKEKSCYDSIFQRIECLQNELDKKFSEIEKIVSVLSKINSKNIPTRN